MPYMTSNVRRGKTTEKSTAGSYAEKPLTAPEATLGDTRDWGSVELSEGSRTPWGSAQWVTDYAPGIASVSTAGHGGVKLSRERNAEIPAPLRRASGWYEEDLEAAIVVRYFPEAFSTAERDAEQRRDAAEETIKNWMPDEWEKVNGRELSPGESREKDKSAWTERHKAEPIVRSAITADSDPELVRVSVEDGSEYLVPKAEYRARADNDEPGRDGRFIVDPARHPKLPPKPAEPKRERVAHKQVPESVVSGSALSQAYIDGALTAAARDSIAKDLGQRWRRDDGRVESLREIVTQNEVALTAYENGTSMEYAVIQRRPNGQTSSMKVSKATWSHLSEFVHDDRSDATRKQQEAGVAAAKLDKFTDGHSFENWYDEKAKKKARELAETAERLRKEANALREAERLADEQLNGTWGERAERTRQQTIERERAARVEGP